jgi:hypothetical protein
VPYQARRLGVITSDPEVAMDRTRWLAFGLVVGLESACGSNSATPNRTPDGGRDSGRVDVGPGFEAGCPGPTSGKLFVQASALPGGNGSMACPMKTITQALALAPPEIDVLPGTYDAALGERFPLIVPGGVKVTGISAPSRLSIVIDGSGAVAGSSAPVTVQLQGELDYVLVKDSSRTASYIVQAIGPAPTLTLDSIQGGMSAAVALLGQPSAAVGAQLSISVQVDISNSLGDGILVDQGLAGAPVSLTATDTAIHDNAGDGVHVKKGTVSNPTVLLGEGPLACSCPPPTGVVSLYCNDGYGIETDTAVEAQGDAWDHATPTSGTAPADVNSAVLVTDTCGVGAATGACMK